MCRRLRLCGQLLALASLLAATVLHAAEKAPRPNVILFLVDDMGWRDSTPYGSKYYDTPALQRLAERGMRFTQAYSQPLCSPTRASLLTGQYSARHGITSATGHQQPQPAGHSFLPATTAPNAPLRLPESKNYLDPAQHYTLAEALRDAGYRTGHFGKWHLGLTPPHWPEQHGFQVAFHAQPSAGPPGAYFSPYGVAPPDAGKPAGDQPQAKAARTHRGTITDGPAGEYITDRLTDEALRFIAASGDQPFYLNLWHYGVHGPWGHKESLTAQMAERRDPSGLQGNPVMASMLKSIDESLGRILDKLDELKIADHTLLIFTSDNGGNTHSLTKEDAKAVRREDALTASYRKWAGFQPPTNNAPLRDGKGRLYEGGVRVPLMVCYPPQVQAGAVADAVVGCIDVYPTVLDLLGLPAKPNQKIDGVSYAPVLRGAGPLAREAYFIWFPHLVPGVSVRRGDWKLIRRFSERPEDYAGLYELFNLKDDLGETTNLAARLPDKVRELDALIDAFVRDTGAVYPQANPAYKPAATSAIKRPSPGAAAGPPAGATLTRGLVMQNSAAELIADGVRITAKGAKPYLGTAQVKLRGPLVLTLRIRSPHGGEGAVRWRTSTQDDFPAEGQRVAFTLKASEDWQDLRVELPIEGETRIVQLHLPATAGPVDLQAVQYQAREGAKAWRFTTEQPK